MRKFHGRPCTWSITGNVLCTYVAVLYMSSAVPSNVYGLLWSSRDAMMVVT